MNPNPLPVPLVDDWLMAHPAIRKVVVWSTHNQVQYYLNWSAEQKDALQQAFNKAWTYQPSGLSNVPVNLSPNTPAEAPACVMSPAEAWSFYLAHLGHSLAQEIGKRLKWSLLDYTTQEASIILDSREWLKYDGYLKGYRIIADKNGYYTPAPPDYILNFLTKIQFLEPIPPNPHPDPEKKPAGTIYLPPSAQRNAILRLMDWGRHNLFHFGGGMTTDNMKAHWQYHGFPPIARVVEGTLKGDYPLMHWTAGCRGTVGFFIGVLRTINIPVQLVFQGGHSLPYFMHERAYLSHGDDLYSPYTRNENTQGPLPYPSAKLLLSSGRFKEWFGPHVSPPDKNIGRRPREVALLYLPARMLRDYCADKAAKVTHANGKIFQAMNPYYSLEELEQAKLWERLEARLIELGGCEAIKSMS
ncbi:hypothetical protein [Spirosoma sp.]|uniref:hypothetical protein n=1 Tax=Spirosoma sp. TaxID=1899569 RepID=UPI003B3B6CBA